MSICLSKFTAGKFGGSAVGPPGPPGVCSCNLTSFIANLTLPDLIPGPPGVPGIDGKAGPPGTSVSLKILHFTEETCIVIVNLATN